jgi:hypothetical protein
MHIEDLMEQFGKHRVCSGQNAAKLKHFSPDTDNHDRFGNRIFTSPDTAYWDRQGNLTKSNLLVSNSGQEFIHSHHGILKQLESGLSILHSNQELTTLPLAAGSLQKYRCGHQSEVYLLELEDKYIIKTQQPYTDIDQPYVNEMLQTQTVAAEFNRYLTDFQFGFQRFLFASSFISCTAYEPGCYPTEQELETPQVAMMCSMVEQYVNQKQLEADPLWKNIIVDYQYYDIEGWRINNFIQRPDGYTIWIDPFFYSTFSVADRRRLRKHT